VDSLIALLRSELAAAEAYSQAVGRFAGHSCQDRLRRIWREHETAAAVLRNHICNLGGDPDEASGPPDTFAASVAGAASPAGLLAALRQGEERGLADYEAVLRAEEMPAECRFAVRGELLPRRHEHIDVLADLGGSPRPKG